ncbi:hypothetical protein QL285_054421 [Trifolium repens]|nr:hypothetical protein QL285_054421 [Trifolium repens]
MNKYSHTNNVNCQFGYFSRFSQLSQNHRDNVLDCTLWDALSVENLSFYNQRTDFGPVDMIIKHARVKEPQGVYPLHLTNVWNGTGQLFDPKIHEIKAFLTCFILKLLMGLNINRMKSS